MPPTDPTRGRQWYRIVAYSRDDDEEVSDIILEAGNVDVSDEATTLHEWVNADVFETIRWNDRPVWSTRIWEVEQS